MGLPRKELWIMVCIPVTYTDNLNVFKNVIFAETFLGSIGRGKRQDEIKEDYQTSGILQAGNRLIGFFDYEHVLTFRKKQ